MPIKACLLSYAAGTRGWLAPATLGLWLYICTVFTSVCYVQIGMKSYEMFINNIRTAESWDSLGPINTIRSTVSQNCSSCITTTAQACLFLVTKKPITFFKDLPICYSITFHRPGKCKGIIFRNQIERFFRKHAAGNLSASPGGEGGRGRPLKRDVQRTGTERGYTIQNPPCANCRYNFNYLLNHAHSTSLCTLASTIFFLYKNGRR